MKRSYPIFALLLVVSLLFGCGGDSATLPTSTPTTAGQTFPTATVVQPPTATAGVITISMPTPADLGQLPTATNEPPTAELPTATTEPPTAELPTATSELIVEPTATNAPPTAAPIVEPTATNAPAAEATATSEPPTVEPTLPPSQPITQPANNRIALILDGRMATVNPDGSDLKMLTGAGAAYPRWSPDHRYLAYTMDEGNGDTRLHVVRTDGSGDVGIPDSGGADANPAWSPNSSQLAFEVRNPDRTQLAVINRDGSGLKTLTEGQVPTWRADGQVIGFVSGPTIVGNQNNGFRLINANGQNEWQPLGSDQVPQDLSAYDYPFGPGTNSLTEPRFSPTLRNTFAVAAQGHSGLVLVVSDQGSIQQIVGFSYEGGIGTLDWSPTQPYLAYVNAGASGYDTINVVDVTQQKFTSSTPPLASFGDPQTASGYHAPAWSPDGKRMAMIANNGSRNTGLAVVSLSGSPRVVVSGNVLDVDW